MCIGGEWSTLGKMFDFKANRAGIWCATAYLSPNAGKEGNRASSEALRGFSPADSMQAPSCSLMFSLHFSPFYHCESEGGRENHMSELEFLVYLLWALWFVLERNLILICFCAWENYQTLQNTVGSQIQGHNFCWIQQKLEEGNIWSDTGFVKNLAWTVFLSLNRQGLYLF